MGLHDLQGDTSTDIPVATGVPLRSAPRGRAVQVPTADDLPVAALVSSSS